MVVVPVATGVITPVLEIVATAVLDEVQGVVASAVPEPVSVGPASPIQILRVPLIVGRAFTVNVVVLLQPKEFL